MYVVNFGFRLAFDQQSVRVTGRCHSVTHPQDTSESQKHNVATCTSVSTYSIRMPEEVLVVYHVVVYY